jgi:transcriptional regulator with AAA-type ATPase domain
MTGCPGVGPNPDPARGAGRKRVGFVNFDRRADPSPRTETTVLKPNCEGMPEEDATAPESDSRVEVGGTSGLGIEWLFPSDVVRSSPLDRPRLQIGRDETCQMRFDLPSVSRHHAEIHRDGPIFAVRDLRSRNGTFLNGKAVTHGALAPGDVLRVGGCLGLVVAGKPGPRARLKELAPDVWGGEELEQALEPARRAATSSLPVVLVGETGSGKERAARAIHHFSEREGGFHALNCASLPEQLVEAELFGYSKGAFTGAERTSVGRLRAAHRGTLLLDEIAELPLGAQAKLLRVLETGSVVPLGENRAHEVDVRVLAASQTPLEQLVQAGTFRQDLRARLAGLVVTLPPLRARRLDIVPLLLRLLLIHSGGRPPGVDVKLAEALCLHDWPDNVRELELLVRRLLALHGSETTLKRRHLPESMRGSGESLPPRSGPWFPQRGRHDLHHLAAALKQTSGNVKAAAACLGFSRQRAYRLMCGKTASEIMAEWDAGAPVRVGDDRELSKR